MMLSMSAPIIERGGFSPNSSNEDADGATTATTTTSSSEYPMAFEDFSQDRYGFSAQEQSILNEMMKTSHERQQQQQQQQQEQSQTQTQTSQQQRERGGATKTSESSISSRLTAMTELESPYDTDGISVGASVMSGSVDVVRSRLSNEEVAFLWGDQSASESNDDDDGDFDGSISPMTHNSSNHSTGRSLLQKAHSQRSMGSYGNKRAQIKRAFSSTSLYSVGEHDGEDSEELQTSMEEVMAHMSNDEWALFNAAMEQGEDFELNGHTFESAENINKKHSSSASSSEGLSPVSEKQEVQTSQRRKKTKKQSSKASLRSASASRSPRKSPSKKSGSKTRSSSAKPKFAVPEMSVSAASSKTSSPKTKSSQTKSESDHNFEAALDELALEEQNGDLSVASKPFRTRKKKVSASPSSPRKTVRDESEMTAKTKKPKRTTPGLTLSESKLRVRKSKSPGRRGRPRLKTKQMSMSAIPTKTDGDESSSAKSRRKSKSPRRGRSRPRLGKKQMSMSAITTETASLTVSTQATAPLASPKTTKTRLMSSKSLSPTAKEFFGQPSLHTIFEWNKDGSENLRNPSDPPAGASKVVKSMETPRKGHPQTIDRRKLLRKSYSTTDVNQFSLTPKWPPKRLANRKLHSQFYRRQTDLGDLITPTEKKESGSVSPEKLLEIIEPMSMRELLRFNGFNDDTLAQGDHGCINYADILDNQSVTSSNNSSRYVMRKATT